MSKPVQEQTVTGPLSWVKHAEFGLGKMGNYFSTFVERICLLLIPGFAKNQLVLGKLNRLLNCFLSILFDLMIPRKSNKESFRF